MPLIYILPRAVLPLQWQSRGVTTETIRLKIFTIWFFSGKKKTKKIKKQKTLLIPGPENTEQLSNDHGAKEDSEQMPEALTKKGCARLGSGEGVGKTPSSRGLSFCHPQKIRAWRKILGIPVFVDRDMELTCNYGAQESSFMLDQANINWTPMRLRTWGHTDGRWKRSRPITIKGPQGTLFAMVLVNYRLSWASAS